jgi:hypothetical protein
MNWNRSFSRQIRKARREANERVRAAIAQEWERRREQRYGRTEPVSDKMLAEERMRAAIAAGEALLTTDEVLAELGV